MKSYSSVVSKSCAAALAPKKIHAAVKKITEKDDRGRNVIIYGVEEKSDEVLREKVGDVLSQFGESPLIKDCCRVGIKREKTCSPVKFTLSSPEQVIQVLRKTKLLRSRDGFKYVYLCPDRTAEERKAFKKLLEQLSEKRKSEPDRVHYIKNNKLISSDRDSEPPGKK